MKVWVIRLSMASTLAAAVTTRFSESALSAGGSQPGHCPACRYPQRSTLTREACPVGRRRFADYTSKRAAERAEAAETDVEANFGHRAVGFAQQFHCSLHPSALKVPMRGLAKRRAK